MVDSEEKKNLRGTIKAPPELVTRIQDETRRLRKVRGLRKDPPMWTVVSTAMDLYEDQECRVNSVTRLPLQAEDAEILRSVMEFLKENGPGSLPRRTLLARIGHKKNGKHRKAGGETGN